MLLLLPDDGTNTSLDHFHENFPEVFAPHADPHLDDDFFPVPVDNPDTIPSHDEPSYAETDIIRSDDLSAEELEVIGAEVLTEDYPFPDLSPNLEGRLRGKDHGGGLVSWPAGSAVPPPDCLAFYLPIHFYHPGWWGVYLLFEGVLWLASYLLRNTGGGITKRQAIAVARKFLYYHEAFHHKTECLSIRLEVTHRVACYKNGFTKLYQSTFGKDECLEEGLANAEALKKVAGFSGAATFALEKMVLASPPGYRRGVEIKSHFSAFRSEFAEKNQYASFPHLPAKNPAVWGAATHMFDGINNVKGKVNYLVPHNSPLVQRLRVRPMLPPRKLVKKLADLAGVTFKRPGGNHDLYQTMDGHVFPIPRHARDINRGLLRGILRQCGIEMGLDEFLRA